MTLGAAALSDSILVISATHWQSELCKHASVSAAGLGGTESPIGRRNDGLRGLGNTRGERNAEAGGDRPACGTDIERRFGDGQAEALRSMHHLLPIRVTDEKQNSSLRNGRDNRFAGEWRKAAV